MLKVIFIRIAQTENNVIRKLSGRTVDSPLTEHGKAMADYVAGSLRSVAPTAVYSGPAPRCQETARHTAQQLGLQVVVCEEFQEFDLGDFDGKNREEISKTEAGRVFLNDPSACEIPEAAESFVVSQQKAISKLQELAQQHKSDSTICIFSHGGTMRLILFGLFGIDLSRFWQFRVDNCGIIVLNSKEDNSFELVELINHTLTPDSGSRASR